jgi:hypothetical protein
MRLNGGIENAGKPMLLPPGAKWQDFAKSMSDAEVIAQRKLGRDEVCAVYDMDPGLLGVGDNIGQAGLATLFPSLFQTTLPPWLTLIQGCVRAIVIEPYPLLRGHWVEFETGDVLRGDPVKEAVARKTDLMSGVITINEARAVRNLAPIDHPDADRPLIPTNNMIFLGDSPTRDTSTEAAPGQGDQTKAITLNVERAADRVYRRLKAGTPAAWNAERFEHELADDLRAAGANGTAADTAKAWAGALSALVADAAGDADAARRNFAVLLPTDHEN